MTNEMKTALRVLKVIKDGGHPSQADALVLRLWAGPRTGTGPLDEIAKQLLEVAAKRVSFCDCYIYHLGLVLAFAT
jgi:hypothetical protein